MCLAGMDFEEAFGASIQEWREQSLRVLDPVNDATPSQRQIACRFLLNWGFSEKKKNDKPTLRLLPSQHR